jgi:uncharacterized LabA/DUF88 family protein
VSKNVAVFVDVANIFYAAKAANVDIDYVTLLKSAIAGRDFVRAYAYTGLDPENENQRNFHQFLARHGYKVVSKDIRKYGDGKVKANLDIELVVDMMKTARNLDVAIVVSGDGDFAPAIRAVQEMGVRVEVISFRGNTSSDLIDVADVFTDITQIAKVEKGSRSGRRVAGDEEDLSMTEVPEKQTEGPARPRSRRGGRGRSTERQPVAASQAAERSGGRGRTSVTVLPGEKLSKVPPSEDVGALAAFGEESEEHEDELAEGEAATDEAAGEYGSDDAPRRRRRRRGGRGRGRGRGGEVGEAAVPGLPGVTEVDEEDLELLVPRPAAQVSSFGSVWDSQLGVRSVPSSPVRAQPEPAGEDEDDFAEPEIPEYLIAERRRGQGQNARGGRGPGMRGGRGRNAAYAAALDRERFGGGRGSTPSRFSEPGRGGRPQQPPRPEPRQEPRRDQRPSGGRPQQRWSEPWSEVPPELEEMLRSQLATKPEARPTEAPPAESAVPVSAASPEVTPFDTAEATTETPKRRPARRGSRAAGSRDSAAEATGEAPSTAADAGTPPETPKRRTTRRSTASATASDAAESAAPAAGVTDGEATTAEAAAPKRRTTRRSTPVTSGAAAEGADGASESAAPKRRTRRTTPAPTE